MKKISVIIPIYNVENYLIKCIDSIINQTYRNLEIILVDDGSTDGCPEICDEYAKKDKRIRVIHKKNGGVSSARNSGISLASGEYITFVDADDSIEQNMVVLLHETIVSKKSDISICNILNIEEGQQPVDIDYQNLTRTLNSREALGDMLYQKNIINGPFAKLYKKYLFEDIRFQEDITIAEDLEANYRLFLKAKKIVTNSSKKYYYLKRQGSAMQSSFNNKRMDGLSITKKILADASLNHCSLIKPSENRLFIEAVLILIALSSDKLNHPSEHVKCVNIIKRYNMNVAFDTKSKRKVRLYAAISLVSVNLLMDIFAIKRYVRLWAQREN